MPELSSGLLSSSATSTITPHDAVRKLIQAQQDKIIAEKIYEVKPQAENEYYFGHNALTQEECISLIGPHFVEEAKIAIDKSTEEYREGIIRKEIFPDIALVFRVVDEGDPFGETPDNPHMYVIKDSYGVIPAEKGKKLEDLQPEASGSLTEDSHSQIPPEETMNENSQSIVSDNVELLRRRLMEIDPMKNADEATVLALSAIQLGVSTPDANNGTKVSIAVYYETATGKIGYFQPEEQIAPGAYSQFHSWFMNNGRQFAQEVDDEGNVQWRITQQGVNEIVLNNASPERVDITKDEKQKVAWGESSLWGESAAGDDVFKKSLEEFNRRFGPQN